MFYARFESHPLLNGLLGIGRLTWSGVDLFFVLSGFLIGGILLDNRESPNFFKTFYLRRAYRILPLYFVVVAFCFITFEAGHHGLTPRSLANWLDGPIPWWSYVTFTQNLWMAKVGGFSRAGLNVTWSLAIEEQFYLTLPLLVRWVAPRKLIFVVVGVVLGAPILRALLIHHLAHGGFDAYVLMPCRADGLGLGVLCAILVRKERTWNYFLAHRSWIRTMVVVLGLGVVAITFKGYALFSGALYGLEYSVLALFYTSVVLVAVTDEDKFVKAVLCNRALTKLGIVAYGTYLLHYLFIDLVQFLVNFLNAGFSPFHIRGASVMGVVVAVMVASISWRFFEKPLVHRAHAYKY
ncbi:MAG TPA: acyltransferase [Candidatus Sulfotelmatobacter sp.]